MSLMARCDECGALADLEAGDRMPGGWVRWLDPSSGVAVRACHLCPDCSGTERAPRRPSAPRQGRRTAKTMPGKGAGENGAQRRLGGV